MPTWLIAFDIIVTTLWTIALAVASLALWNASIEFQKARHIVIDLKIPKGFKPIEHNEEEMKAKSLT